MSKYDTTLFQYFQNLKNQLKVSPLNLGGTAVSSGGPPGGFTGYLPQNRVGYDPYEAAISGFSSATPYNSSGILVDANLIDNLNHIRYRVTSLEELAFTGNYVSVKENEILVASGVTVLNFEGSVTVEETAPAEVTITITSSGTGVDTDEKAKVSANDTTANYLENKIVAGDNISITVLNDGSNETLEINSTASGSGSVTFLDLTDTPDSYSGQAGKLVRVNSGQTALEFVTASGGSGIFSGASLTKSAVQAIGTGSATAITFDGEVYDTDNYHDNVTNNTRLTAPASGWYLVGGTAEMANLNDQNYVVLRIRKGGSVADGDGRVRLNNSSSVGGGYLSPGMSRPVNLNTGEYVELMIEHNYGSNRDVRETSNGTSFWIYRLY